MTDCRANPLAEDKVCTCFENFGVAELDWGGLDLSIEPILSFASILTVLHLYISGYWAVLSHWVSEGGLQKLEKVIMLRTSLMSELTSAAVKTSISPLSRWILPILNKVLNDAKLKAYESMIADQAERYERRVTDQIRELRSKCGWTWHPSAKIEKCSHDTKLTQKVDGGISVAGPEEK